MTSFDIMDKELQMDKLLVTHKLIFFIFIFLALYFLYSNFILLWQNKDDLETKLESFKDWARTVSAKYVAVIPTDKFIDAFVADLETELQLSGDITKLLKPLAYRYAISSTKNGKID